MDSDTHRPAARKQPVQRPTVHTAGCRPRAPCRHGTSAAGSSVTCTRENPGIPATGGAEGRTRKRPTAARNSSHTTTNLVVCSGRLEGNAAAVDENNPSTGGRKPPPGSRHSALHSTRQHFHGKEGKQHRQGGVGENLKFVWSRHSLCAGSWVDPVCAFPAVFRAFRAV